MGKFINPHLPISASSTCSFGREMTRTFVRFLNDLLEGKAIMDLRITNNERLPETEQGRKVILTFIETDKRANGS